MISTFLEFRKRGNHPSTIRENTRRVYVFIRPIPNDPAKPYHFFCVPVLRRSERKAMIVELPVVMSTGEFRRECPKGRKEREEFYVEVCLACSEVSSPLLSSRSIPL